MRARFVGAIVAAVSVAACGNLVSPSNNQILNFGGTVDVAGTSAAHQFTASKGGEYTVTVTSMDPPVAGYFVVVVGFWQSGQCVGVYQGNTYASVGIAAATGPIDKGDYCVYIQDEGFFSGTETYNIKVSHP